MLHDDMGMYDRVRYHPRIHQRIISRLDFGLRLLYQHEKRIKPEPLTEMMVNEDQASATPDLILIDPETEFIHAIIEVCKTTGLKSDIQKVTNCSTTTYTILKKASFTTTKPGNSIATKPIAAGWSKNHPGRRCWPST